VASQMGLKSGGSIFRPQHSRNASNGLYMPQSHMGFASAKNLVTNSVPLLAYASGSP